MLYQTLTGHLYRVPDSLFGLVPQSAEQPRAPLVSTNGQPPLNLIYNAFVTTPRELTTYRSEMSQPLLFHADRHGGCRISGADPEPSSRS